MRGKIKRTINGWTIKTKMEHEDECYYEDYPLFLSNKIVDYLMEDKEVDFEINPTWTENGIINQAKIKL
mgnify:CR=1 FL=1